MSVRVNLLPREFEERSRARRMAALGVLVVLVWVALLAVLLLAKLSAVGDARETRDAAQARVNQLQAEVDALAAFQQLADQVNANNEVLIAAMGGEVSWSTVMNNVALTMPTTSSLTALDGELIDVLAGQAPGGDVFVENDLPDVGFLTLNGYSVERFAPGVEAILLRFGEVESFFQQFLSDATADDISGVGVTTFTAEVRLDEGSRTGRYVDGLPEETP